MIKLYGLTEIVGLNAVGKSIFAISVANSISSLDCKIIYITKYQVKFGFFPQSILYKKLDSFTDLKIVLFYEIPILMKIYNISIVIIDNFEDFFTEK